MESETNDTLITALKASGVLKTTEVEKAMRTVDRADFVPAELRPNAYLDTALPIGYGQTISQPTVVAFCLELLEASPGNRVLDIGSGSGWTTVLLAHLVGESGKVVGVERIPELVAFGQGNLAKYALQNAHIEQAGKKLGKPNDPPFDRILVSAGTDEIPEILKSQLAENGRMVLPIQNAICVVNKIGTVFSTNCYDGYVFVPLIT